MRILPAFYALITLLPATLLAGEAPVIQYHAQTGKVRFIQGEADVSGGNTAARTGSTGKQPPLQRYAPLFGIDDVEKDLTLSRRGFTAKNRRVARYQQQYNGLPVIGGELVVNTDSGGRMLSMNGEISPEVSLDTTPTLNAEKAKNRALQAVAKWYALAHTSLVAPTPKLAVYDPRLIANSSQPASLVWQIEVMPRGDRWMNELVLIDANSGAIALHYNQIHTVRNRLTHTAAGTANLPGTLVCDESQPLCSNGTDLDADAAHQFAGDTYDFYFSRHGRDSIDDNGMDIVSVVDFDDGQICPNAFWDGARMVYCDTFSQADDVVAHELTHGITQATSNLRYINQSGAINESLSDIWGEFVDLTNASGNDSSDVRWQMGEDLPGFGAIRNMANPPAFNHPDRIGSPLYFTGTADQGGVHINNGVNNKAASLMVDGGTFNGFTVAALGIDKTASIYYEAQTNLLTSASDYADLFAILNQACLNVIGTTGIVATDCNEVNKALLAVEMNQGDTVKPYPEAAICDSSDATIDVLLQDNLDTNTALWNNQSLTGANQWVYLTGYATSGTQSFYDNSNGTTSDYAVALNTDITLPANSVPFLHFRHAFDFEQGLGNFYDGGFIEYSTDGGNSWQDAAALIDAGANYAGNLDTVNGNPNAGRAAFVGSSRGYTSSRVALASFAGQNIRFRWRSSYDPSVKFDGWFIDDIQVYTCNVPSQIPTADAGPDQTTGVSRSVTLDAGNSSSPNSGTLTFQWIQTAGASVVLNNAATATPTFTTPSVGGTLTFQVTVTNNGIASDTDIINIVVKTPPLVNAGGDRTVSPGTLVSLSGLGNSSDGTPVSYQWSQAIGPAVTLNSPNSAATSFTAPTVDTQLFFVLTVTDNLGQTGTDSVSITVATPPADSPGSDDGGSSAFGYGALFLLLLTALRRKRNHCRF